MMAAMVKASRGVRAVPVTSHGLTGVAFDHGSSADLFVWASGTTAMVTLGSGDSVGTVGGQLTAKTGKSTVQVGSAPMQITVSTGLASFLGGQ